MGLESEGMKKVIGSDNMMIDSESECVMFGFWRVN